MFLGEYEHTLDEKGRITIPAKFRGELASGLVITKGLDRCLVLHPVEQFKAFAAKVIVLPVTSAQARGFRRLEFAGAVNDEPDKQGRVGLPNHLREYANIDKQVVIIGLYDHCEIWNPETWQELKQRSDNDSEGRAEQFASLGI
jgi:transcriptional regulator MraZ